MTGVGVEVSFSAAQGGASSLVVVAPAPGGPAERAGVRPGDVILSIDGQPTSSLSLYAAGNALRHAVVVGGREDGGVRAAYVPEKAGQLMAAPVSHLPAHYPPPPRAGNLLQGAEGSEVVLSVSAGGSGAPRDLRLQRQPILYNPVDSALCSSGGACGAAAAAADRHIYVGMHS